MMPMTAEQARLRARTAGLACTRPDDDPELVAARTELADANRRARARRNITRALATLTPGERHQLLSELAAGEGVPR